MVAISRRSQKATDALELGADEYIATDDGNDWPHRHASSLDLIICTVSSSHMPLQAYLGLLRPKGRFWQVGIPEQALPRLNAMVLVLNGTSLSFSDSASPGNIRERGNGKARFRFVLENTLKVREVCWSTESPTCASDALTLLSESDPKAYLIPLGGV